MSALLSEIAYTFVPSLIVAMYLGVWLAKHGDNWVTGRQIFELAIAVRAAAIIGPLSYVITAPSVGESVASWVRVFAAIFGNAFACPLAALFIGGTLRLFGVRNRPMN